MVPFRKSFLKKLSRLAVFFVLINLIVLESYPALVYGQINSTSLPQAITTDSGGSVGLTPSTPPTVPILTSLSATSTQPEATSSPVILPQPPVPNSITPV